MECISAAAADSLMRLVRIFLTGYRVLQQPLCLVLAMPNQVMGILLQFVFLVSTEELFQIVYCAWTKVSSHLVDSSSSPKPLVSTYKKA